MTADEDEDEGSARIHGLLSQLPAPAERFTRNRFQLVTVTTTTGCCADVRRL